MTDIEALDIVMEAAALQFASDPRNYQPVKKAIDVVTEIRDTFARIEEICSDETLQGGVISID